MTLTPEQWLAMLEQRLDHRTRMVRLFEDYYNGDHRLTFATSKFREAFGSLFSAFASNWCALVVDAPVERLHVEGFRFGAAGTGADDMAWAIWQANNLDAESRLAHREAVKCGEAYVLVEPVEDGPPKITVEHPSQVIVATEPGNRRRRLAALKKWMDDDGHYMATLYLPDGVFKFRSKDPVRAGVDRKIEWQPRAEMPFVVNPLGRVPVIALQNSPTMLGGGQSDLAGVVPLQDAANKMICDMLVASEFVAFPQRYATGLEVPNDPVTGEPRQDADLKAAVSRLWAVADPDVKFGEFSPGNLGNYVQATEMIVQHIAAQTRTPPHYLLGQSGAFPSGESLKSTETGLVARVEEKQAWFGEGWEEAMRLAFLAAGDEQRANQLDAETLWKDPESRTEGELVDALVKMRSLNVPYEELWRRWGVSPQDTKRWLTQLNLPQRDVADPNTGATPEGEVNDGDRDPA